MEIEKVASTSFVRLEDTWPAGRSVALVKRLNPAHVILRRGGPPELSYLLPRREVLYHLGRIPESAPTGQAFVWGEMTPAPMRDAHEDADGAPDLCIVEDEGR